MSLKLLFVTPWYGAKIPGGMEAETRRTAQQLALAGFDVSVATTCIRDFYADWDKNYYRAGVSVEDGVRVHRFKVGKRNKSAFDGVNAQLMAGRLVSAEEEQTYINEMINCPDLYDFLRQTEPDTILIFIPYMFATTYFGAQIHPERSLIIPCLHDEAYARMQIYADVLPHLHTMILHTYAERDLADQLFGNNHGQERVVLGEGVDSDFSAEPQGRTRQPHRFRQKYNIEHPFVYYTGRREAGKNVPLLLRYWSRYVSERSTPIQLLLSGPGDLRDLPPQTRDLGFIPKQDMHDALAAASVFCLPSVNESFSLVTIESWLARTPVLVHGDCAVTREHCVRSNGGLYFQNYAEFAATLDFLLTKRDVAERMGELGRSYVLNNFTWPIIIEKYKELLAGFKVKG